MQFNQCIWNEKIYRRLLSGRCGKRIQLMHRLPYCLLRLLVTLQVLSVIVLSLTLSTLYVGPRPGCDASSVDTKGTFCWLGLPVHSNVSSPPTATPCHLLIATSSIGFVSSLIVLGSFLVYWNKKDGEETRLSSGITSIPNVCLWFATLVYVANLWSKNRDDSTPFVVVSTTEAVLVFAGFNFFLWVLLQKVCWKLVNY